MAMKLKLNPRETPLTPEEQTLQNRYQEYQTFLKQKEKEAKVVNPKDAIARAKKLLAARDLDKTQKKTSHQLKRPSAMNEDEEERAAKKPKFDDEDFGGPSYSQSSKPSLSQGSNDIASPASPRYSPDSVAPVSLMDMDIASDSKDSHIHKSEEDAVLCITNLPENLTEEKLRPIVEPFGFVLSIELFSLDRYALIRYEDASSVERATESLEGTEIDGSIVIAYAAEMDAFDTDAAS